MSTTTARRYTSTGPTSDDRTSWGGPNRCDPGMLCAPHSLALDSRGDLYVGEVTWTYGLPRGYDPDRCGTLQKFSRL